MKAKPFQRPSKYGKISSNSGTLQSMAGEVASRNATRMRIYAAAYTSTNNWDIEPVHLALTKQSTV